jgi:FolB domain-containing protein
MDTVFITDLVVRGIIGVYDWERQQPQDILINIAVNVDLQPAGELDDISAGIDYAILAQKVIAHTESAQRLTVEALANDIALICLEEPRAESVKVRVEKPGAVRFARSVGVEIERHRQT